MATQIGAGAEALASDAAIHRFMELQSQVLDHYGVRAASRFVALNRPPMRAHVLEAGAGEPLIILHGGDGEAVNWAPLMAPLQKAAHIYAVDRPGFGLSDAFDYRSVDLRSHAADFIESLLDALGLQSATLVGGSMGGFFALAAAIALPRRVRRLVLVGYPVGASREIAEGIRILGGTPGLAEQFMQGRDTLEAQHSQYRDMFNVDLAALPDVYFEARIAGLRLPSEQGTWATLLQRLADLDGVRPDIYLGDDLRHIEAPTLILWGENDLSGADLGRAIASDIPAARFQYLPGVGHLPFLEAPWQAAELISTFVNNPLSA
jgi:pimeloyl-ACP methyl ester carboxylesterase